MNSGKIILGVLGGIAAGAIAGILLAPEKGSKTRKKIMDKGKGYADDMKIKFEDLYQNATSKHENVLQDSKELVKNNEMK